MYCFTVFPRTSVQVQSLSKLMPAMYCITHKIFRSKIYFPFVQVSGI
jgi:hypothetical protein